jgi:hypothetical protein
LANYNTTIYATADTYLDGQFGGLNFGSSATMKIHEIKAAVMGFNLASIPADKVITRIDVYFYVNGFTSEGDPSLAGNTGYSYVIKARKMLGHTLSEIETNLSYGGVWADGTSGNILRTNNTDYDSSLNITSYYGAWAAMGIGNIERPENNELLIGLRQDSDYITNNLKMRVCYANILTRTSAYAPYIIVYYSDPAPKAPTDLVPNATARNRAGEIKLTWQNESIQTAYTLQYSKDNFATYTTATGGSGNSYTIPANTFAVGNTVKWRVRITDNLSTQSDWSEIATFTIGSTVPSAPTIVSPVNTSVNSGEEIYFRWRFVDAFGYTQSKYDLQYKKAGETETTATVTSDSLIHIMLPNTIGGGNYLWRVRCYNPFAEVSPYSEWYSFYSIGKPETPTITGITNNMHPVISWSGIESDLFRIKIYSGDNLLHDYGELTVPDLKQYKVLDFLDNGAYKASLQISNIYGLWSNEIFLPFTINTVKPVKPNLYGNSTEDLSIALIVSSLTTANLLYRKSNKDKEYKLIANLETNTFTDHIASHGDNSYFVRAVTLDSFNDSDTIIVNLEFDGIVLNCIDNLSNYINLWITLNSDKRKGISASKDQYLIQCNGRTYPISQTTEFKGHAENHEYAIEYEEFDKVYELLNCPVLIYRNDKGYRYPVQIPNPNYNENELNRYVVTFTLTRLEE